MASLGSTANESTYRYKLMLEKCLFFNSYLFQVWTFVIAFTLAEKVKDLEKLTIYLTVTAFILLIVLEVVRTIIGHIAVSSNRIPELGGFLLITNVMHLPILSYFLFNPYLTNSPIEIMMTGSQWALSVIEVANAFHELKQTSAITSDVYYVQLKKDADRARDGKIKTKE